MPQGPQAELAGRTLEYPYPEVVVKQGTRTASFEPIGEPAVTQVLGAESRKLTIKGYAHPYTAGFIDTLAKGETVQFFCYRGSGTIVILDTSTQPLEDHGGMVSHEGQLRHTYTIEAAEAGENSWTPRVGSQADRTQRVAGPGQAQSERSLERQQEIFEQRNRS